MVSVPYVDETRRDESCEMPCGDGCCVDQARWIAHPVDADAGWIVGRRFSCDDS